MSRESGVEIQEASGEMLLFRAQREILYFLFTSKTDVIPNEVRTLVFYEALTAKRFTKRLQLSISRNGAAPATKQYKFHRKMPGLVST